MRKTATLEKKVKRFLDAWFGVRQLVQAANFNRFQKAGLSATQFMTLNLIPGEKQGMTLSELAKRMNLGTATVAGTIDSLESRGLLTRTRSDSDRRQVLLELTRQGKKLQNSASTEFNSHMTALFNRMSAEQRDGLVEGLEALLQVNAGLPNADDALPGKHSARRSPKR